MAIGTAPSFAGQPRTLSNQVGRLKAPSRSKSGMSGSNPFKIGDMTHQQGGEIAQPYGSQNPTTMSSPFGGGGTMPEIPGGGYAGGWQSKLGPNVTAMESFSPSGGDSGPPPASQFSYRPPAPQMPSNANTGIRRTPSSGGINRNPIGGMAGAYNYLTQRNGPAGGGMNTGPSNMNQGNMVSGTPMAYSMVGGVPVPYGNTIDFYKTLMTRGLDIMDPNTFTPDTLRSLGYGG